MADPTFDDENFSCVFFNSLSQDLQCFQQKQEKSGFQFTSTCHQCLLSLSLSRILPPAQPKQLGNLATACVPLEQT